MKFHTLGSFLKKKRTEAGLTRLVLSKEVDIHSQQIYNIESGQCKLPYKFIKRYAKVLKVSPTEILDQVMTDFRNHAVKEMKSS